MTATALSKNEVPAAQIFRQSSAIELPVILVVDDDARMRRFIHAVVRCAMASSGFLADVIEAADSETARSVGREIDAIDLLISDSYPGPGESGVDLARDLICSHPHMRVLLISGAGIPNLPDEWHVLLKPFRVSELFDFCQRVLRP